MVSSYKDIPYYITPHMKPFYCSVFEIWDINTFWDYKDTISNKYKKWMVSSYMDIPYYMHTSYETIYCSFWDMGH